MHTTNPSSPDVLPTAPSSLVSPKLIFAILLLLAVSCPAEVQKAKPPSRSVTAPSKKPTPTIHSRSENAVLDKLNQRYAALTAAASTGDPQQVADATQPVLALALRQVANLRMLVAAYPQAEELYRQSLQSEDDPEARMGLAMAAIRLDNNDAAIEQTTAIVAKDPSNFRAWFIDGKARMAKKDYKGAVESLNHAVATGTDVNAQYALGYSLLMTGDKPRAEKVFQSMLDSYGDKAIWHIVFAGAYRESDNIPDAIREFKQGISMDDNVDHAHFFLGLTLLEQNHWARTDESMAEFREAVQQYPKDFSANLYLGIGESQLQMFADSDKHLLVAAESDPNTPSIWLYLGLNDFQLRNYPEAKQHLLKAIEITGADESQNNYQIRRAYIALGRIFYTEGDHANSEKYVQRAKAMQMKSLEASADSISEKMESNGMGQAAALMPQVKLPTHDEVPQSATVDPAAPIDSSLLANTKLKPAEQEQVQQLENEFRKVLSSAYNDWGTANARRGDYQKALDLFHQAEQWDDRTPSLMRNTGIAALKLNDEPEAVRALDRAVQIDPADQSARSRLAMTEFMTDKYPAAIKNFQSLGEATFADPRMAYAFGYSLVRDNHPREATPVLNRLLTLDIPANMLVNIGDLYSVLQDYEHAVISYKKAIALDPNYPKAHYKMGSALLRLDRPDTAIPEFEAELKSSPDDKDVQYNLAYSLLQTSQKDRALAMLRTLLAAHPEHPEAQYQLGKTLLADGQVDEAIQHLEAAEKLDNSSAYVHYQLQSAYRRAGRKEDADREAKIYRDIKARKREEATIPMPEHVK